MKNLKENIVIRVRTKAGTWRIENVDLSKKLSDFLKVVETEQQVKITKVSLDQNLKTEATGTKTLKQLGLKHGSMIFVYFLTALSFF